MNARQPWATTLGCVLACAPAIVVQSAPTEYTTVYYADSSFESSGTGRFIYDPKTQRVSELVWDFGNGWEGSPDESYPQDPNLAPLLLSDLIYVPAATVRLVPPYSKGPFSSVQWEGVGFNNIRFYRFTRPQQSDLVGNLISHKRRIEARSVFVDHFENAILSASWNPANDGWISARGTYSYDTATVADTAITTLNGYDDSMDPAVAPTPVLAEGEPFWVNARLLNRSAIAGSGSGIVYNYQDAGTFNEVVLSALGTIELRQIRNGSLATIATDAYEEGGQDLWVDVELRRAAGRTSVIVNGETIFRDVLQNTLAPGRIGLVAHRTLVSFDDVRIARPVPNPPFKETFDTSAPAGWIALRGNWKVASGTYVAPVQATAMAISPAAVPEESDEWQTFGFRARMLNPYGANGNRVGLTYNGGQNEIVVTPTGDVYVNNLDPSGRITDTRLVRGTGRDLRHKWFEVEISREWSPIFPVTYLYLDGELLFTEPAGAWPGMGLVTHWSPGRFDDVAFRMTPFPHKQADTFEDGTPFPLDTMVRSGVWERVEPGTLDSRAVGPRDILTFPVPIGGDVDFVYRARLLNEYGGKGNWVGLVTNYNDDGEYYETLFSATGEVRVNKVVKGQVIRQATARHTVPPDKWFTVELRRTGTRTAVKVNGQTVLTNLPQGQIRGGFVGFVTHWSRAKFDDLSWEELR
jgi:hypothetical protein